MLTQEQLAARHIGGSDVAVILDLSPYKTPLELYLEKTGTIQPEQGNSKTRAGHAFETVISHMVSERTGRKLRRSNITRVNPAFPWLTVHIDRDYVGIPRGLEIKNVSPNMAKFWGRDGTADVAEMYVPQPHTYMLVMDYPEWDVAAFFGGDDMRLYPLERDPEWDALIIEATHTFWYDHVLKGVPPKLSHDHPGAMKALNRIFPGTDGTTISGGDDLLAWLKTKEDAAKRISALEKVVEVADVVLREAMGSAAVLTLPDGSRVERKLQKRSGYTVEPAEFYATRTIKPRKEKE